MSKHTPGPWGISPIKKYAHDGPGIYPKGADLPVAVVRSILRKEEERQANARLIAAAPDMLEALELAVDGLEPGFPFRSIKAFEKMHAAIAKAKRDS